MGSNLGIVDDAFGHWLAGFIDGEGCFQIQPQPGTRLSWYPRFHIKLRADDRPVLAQIHERLGIGRMFDYEPTARALSRLAGSKPSTLWVVAAQSECALLVQLLDCYPLRAKKARDYALWREAVSARARHDWARMAALNAALRKGRVFDCDVEAAVAVVADEQLELAGVA